MRLALLPSALLLAACGGTTPDSAAQTGEIDLKNASVAEVARQTESAGDLLRFEPGRWQTTSEVVEAELPGTPPHMVEQLRDQMMAKSTTASCLTADQTKTPLGEMFGGNRGNCRFDHIRMKGGKIDAAMTCAGDGAGNQAAKMTITGDFSKAAFNLDNRLEAAPGSGPAIRMRTRVTGKRLGACT